MKVTRIPYALAVLLLATGCGRRCDDIVCETYVHRYGVPLDPEDWSNRGQHGQVLAVRKDGVVVAKSYDSGVLHGETTYTYPHRDIIQKKETYDQGNLTQETWNYSNGLPYKQVTHENPTRQVQIIWYENGAPQGKEEFEQGRLVRGEYFNPNNGVESVVENQNGTRFCRDRYGELESVDEIRDGYMVLRTTYHSNGTPSSITPFVNGIAEGQKKTFSPGGEPLAIENWTGGYQHGITTIYENGERYADAPYVRGVKHGNEQRYRDGNTLVEEISWVQGRRHGPCYTYIGNTKKTDWYFQDRPVNKQTYDALSNQ